MGFFQVEDDGGQRLGPLGDIAVEAVGVFGREVEGSVIVAIFDDFDIGAQDGFEGIEDCGLVATWRKRIFLRSTIWEMRTGLPSGPRTMGSTSFLSSALTAALRFSMVSQGRGWGNLRKPLWRKRRICSGGKREVMALYWDSFLVS